MLVFAWGSEGDIPRNGASVGDGRITPHSGPEIADGPGRTVRLAVIVPDTGETAHLRPGDRVVFHEGA